MELELFFSICVYTLGAVLGLCVGSFLNVVIYRLPNNMSLAKPDSHCTNCGYVLKWYDNIPILSYIILGGACRKCKSKISPRYIAVEAANCLLWVLSIALFWDRSIVYAVTAAIVSSALICIFFIDLEHMLIYNRFTAVLALGGIVLMFFDKSALWYDRLIGGLAGAAVFAGVYYASIVFLKKEGLGWGDVKYAAAAGLLLGWQRFILAMLIASVAGAVVMSIMSRKSTDGKKEYPFGPYLAIATLISMFIGDMIISSYIGLILG